MKVELLIEPSQEDMAQIVTLREQVWCNEEGLDRATAREIGLIVEDTFDRTAVHCIVRNDCKIVAATRLTIHTSINDIPTASVYKDLVFQAPSPIGVFSRTVVTKAFRNSSGGLLELARYRKAQEIGCNTLIARARSKQRIEMLSVLGFEVLGRINMSTHYPRWPAELEPVALICHPTPFSTSKES